jgi:hypothetical protein
MSFYSYGLLEEQAPGAINWPLLLNVLSPEVPVAVTRKGPNLLPLSAATPQLLGPGSADPFTSDFAADFGGGPSYIYVSINKFAHVSSTESVTSTPLKFTSKFAVASALSAQILTSSRKRLGVLNSVVASPSSPSLYTTHPYHAVVAAQNTYSARVLRTLGKNILGSSIQTAAIVRALGHLLAVTPPSTQVASGLRSTARLLGAIEANVAAAFRSPSRILASVSAEVLLRVVGVSKRVSATSGYLALITRSLPLHINAASAETARLTLASPLARVLSAVSSEVSSLQRSLSSLRNTVSPEVAQVSRGPGRALFASSPSIAVLLKTAGKLAGAISTSVVGAAVRTPGLVRRALSAEVVTANASRFVAFVARGSTQAQSLQIFTPRSTSRIQNIPNTQTVAVAISAKVSYLRTLAVQQGQTVAVAAHHIANLALPILSGALQLAVRTAGHALSVVSPQTTPILSALRRAVSLSVASASIAFQHPSHGKTIGLASTQAAALLPQHLRNLLAGALTASGTSLRLGSFVIRSLLAPQTLSSSKIIGKAFSVAGTSVVSLVHLYFRVLTAASTEAAAMITRRGSSVSGVVSSNVASIRRATGKLAAVLSGQAIAQGRIEFKILHAVTTNIASMTRPRSLLLGARQSQAASIVRWYYLFVAQRARQQTTLLPPGGGKAEPPSFGPIDPADQTTFAFDWSARADPNDAIVSATVVSVPPGLVFGPSPVFINGTLVEVSLMPIYPVNVWSPVFSSQFGSGVVPVLQLPTTFLLRCTCVFASGRRSSFSIPVPVRML